MFSVQSFKPIKQMSQPLLSKASNVLSKGIETLSKDSVELSSNTQKQTKPGFLKTCYNVVKSFLKAIFNGIKKLFKKNPEKESKLNPNAQKTYDEVKAKLGQKTKVSAETIDERFNGYKSGNKELDEMKKYYEDMNKENKAEFLHNRKSNPVKVPEKGDYVVKDQIMENGRKVTVKKVYEGGELKYTAKSYFDKSTGVRTQVTKYPDGKIYVTMLDNKYADRINDFIPVETKPLLYARLDKNGCFQDTWLEIQGLPEYPFKHEGLSVDWAKKLIADYNLPFDISKNIKF